MHPDHPLAAFPITKVWAPANPDVLQYYGLATPNGVKVSIMLEEIGLPYEAHRVPLDEKGTQSAAFRSLNPNGKIPAIIDPDGIDGGPVAIWESGAILIYLANKSGRFLPRAGQGRYETIQWLMWQMGGLGPMVGQVGFFHKFAGKAWEDKRPRDRYVAEARRLLSVLDARLADRDWIMGADYTIADIASLGWVRNIVGFYEAGDLVGFDDFTHVAAWLERGLARPAVQRGLSVAAV